MNKEIEGNEIEIKEAQDQLNKSEKAINDFNKAINDKDDEIRELKRLNSSANESIDQQRTTLADRVQKIETFRGIVEERIQIGRQLEQEIARLESVLFIQLIFRSLN